MKRVTRPKRIIEETYFKINELFADKEQQEYLSFYPCVKTPNQKSYQYNHNILNILK